MCSQWNKIGRAFEQHIELAGERGFARLKESCPVLGPLARATELNAILDDPRESGPRRDRIVSELTLTVSRGGAAGQLASAFLWRGFWPALTTLLERGVAVCAEDPSELAADLADKFATAIYKHNAGKAGKVAGTLLLNTRRDFRKSLRERNELALLEVPLDGDPDYHAVVAPLADAIDALADLGAELGEDADIVVACVVEGFTTAEAAVRFGISREAVKKRLQRAAARLRKDPCTASHQTNIPKENISMLDLDRGKRLATSSGEEQSGGLVLGGGKDRDGGRGASHLGGQMTPGLACRRSRATTLDLTDDIRRSLLIENRAPLNKRRADVLVVGHTDGHDQRLVAGGLVSYCDSCRRWGARGSEHTCGENWSEHLGPVLTTLARRMS